MTSGNNGQRMLIRLLVFLAIWLQVSSALLTAEDSSATRVRRQLRQQDPCAEQALCAVWCQNGYQLDSRGCRTCNCRPVGGGGSSGPSCATVRCGYGQVCREVSVQCIRAPCPAQVMCVDQAPSQPTRCPPLCRNYCPYGRVRDANGCPTCRCLPQTTTPPPRTQQVCAPGTCDAGTQYCVRRRVRRSWRVRSQCCGRRVFQYCPRQCLRRNRNTGCYRCQGRCRQRG